MSAGSVSEGLCAVQTAEPVAGLSMVEPVGPSAAEADAVVLALQALQQRGAAQAEPVAWAHLQALAKRRAGHSGPARHWLDARLASAAAALAQRLPGAIPAPPAQPMAAVAGPGPLAGLVALLNGTPAPGCLEATAASPVPSPGPAGPAGPAAPARPAAVPGTTPPAARAAPVAATGPVQRPSATLPPPLQPAGLPALKSLQRFKGTWARLSAEQRLARSQAQVPQGSGPLNSQWLVQRALQRLQALSPAYLQHFVAQADALLWLQQAASPAPVAGQVLRGDGEAQAAKRKTRPKAKAGTPAAPLGAAEAASAAASASAGAGAGDPGEPGPVAA